MNHPTVTVRNRSTHNIRIVGIPDWDDQELLINGEVSTQSYTLDAGQTATVGVDWDGDGENSMMGVAFSQDSEGSKAYYLEVGQEPDSGNLSVTETYTNDRPDVWYALSDQTPWSMGMHFIDAF